MIDEDLRGSIVVIRGFSTAGANAIDNCEDEPEEAG